MHWLIDKKLSQCAKQLEIGLAFFLVFLKSARLLPFEMSTLHNIASVCKLREKTGKSGGFYILHDLLFS